jgi:CRISPR system Cascade subunit CasE
LVLNLGSAAARRDLADAYEMHSTLMRLVDAGASKPLWRLGFERDGGSPVLLVQTEAEPDFDAFSQVDESYLLHAESKRNRLIENLTVGDRLRFRVRANPTVTREGKRHGLVRHEEQIAWMERQLQRHGARPLSIHANGSQREVYKRRRGRAPITLIGVTFDGVLEIADLDGTRALVKNGVGHARALGFGLVTLAR